MSRIKIWHASSITEAQALERVLMVVKNGRISKTSRGNQYCFVSSWADGIVVHADLTRAGVDSFQVVREEEQNDH